MKIIKIIIFIFLLNIVFIYQASAENILEIVKGRILLQVEEKGQAWYVNPVDSQRYYLGRPDDAFVIMRFLGLGISNNDLFKIGLPGEPNKDQNLASRLAGRIVLQVEGEGEAYYINPVDNNRYYLGRPADAFSVMRSKGLGITNADLNEISIAKDSLSPKPTVELFVMSICPYALQIEKGILPVIELLDDKIDFKVKFLDYIMHDKLELDENLNQYCLQFINKNGYLNYLSCYIDSGETETCLNKCGIDQGALSTCIAETDKKYAIVTEYNNKSTWLNDRFPKFNVNKEEVAKYGVTGSPTLVIDGQKVSVLRDPATLLNEICDNFLIRPAECTTKLSNEVPGTGFGYSGSNNSGFCN